MILTPNSATIRFPVLAAVIAAAIAIACLPRAGADGGDAPLADYVARPDASYEWRERARYRHGRAEIVELRLHSQTWCDTLWKHRLFLIRPERVAPDNGALLIIGGGRWSAADDSAEPPAAMPDGAGNFVAMAEAMESVVAVLGTVPFQPLLNLTEDALIAHTFTQFLREPGSDWPLLLPMVKSAVRAMDAVQAATPALWELSVERFTVVGGSKRGWTAWLAAAVDTRVNAFVPIVFDAVDLAAHFRHQTAAWGTPSDKISPYTDFGLDRVLTAPEGEALRRIVDPLAYLPKLTAPKLIVNATNDEYFPVDSLNIYWDALEGPKYAVYAPNQPHRIRDIGLIVPSINALHQSVSGGAPMPELAWGYSSGSDVLSLCFSANPEPARVLVWRADSANRDFRDARWRSTPVEVGAGRVDLDRPASGYRAVYADFEFDHVTVPYYLSTTLAVIGPAKAEREMPLPPGHGPACGAGGAATGRPPGG